MEEKDLGSTGFVTVHELAAAMVSEFQVRAGTEVNCFSVTAFVHIAEP